MMPKAHQRKMQEEKLLRQVNRLKVFILMNRDILLGGRQALKDFGELRLQWLKARFLTTRNTVRFAAKNLMFQNQVSRIWDIMFLSLRRLSQGLGSFAPFTTIMSWSVVVGMRQKPALVKDIFHVLKGEKRISS